MAEGLRYDRQTVGRPSSLAAQKLAKKKAGSWYDKPGEWLEAGIEAANEGMRINDFGQWAKELPVELAYRKPREFIVDPLVRTFTGQEARQNYLNPEGGLRLPERALGVASDALNVASVAPIVKGLVAAPQAALRSALTRMAGRRIPAPVKEFSERAGSKAGQAGVQALQTEREIKALLEASQYNSSSANVIYDIGTQAKPPGTIRLWHTNPGGDALPPQLFSMEEAARIPGRRGSGATQLLSGGIYATDARDVSASYASSVLGASRNRPARLSPTIPKFVQDDLARISPNNYEVPSSSLPTTEVMGNINRARSQAILNSAIDIDSPVPDDTKTRLIGWLTQGGRRNDAAFQESLKGLTTWRDFLDAPNIGEEFMRPAWTDLIYDNAGAPFVFKSNQPTMFSLKNNPEAIGLSKMFDYSKGRRGVLVDADNPLYIGKTYANYSSSQQTALKEALEGLAKDYDSQIMREISSGKVYDETPINPYRRSEFSRPPVGPLRVEGEWSPGQNYWDLPIERAGDRIKTLAGSPALDISNMTPKQVDDLFDAIRGFLRSKNVPNFENYLNPHGPIGEYADLLLSPEAEPGTKLEAFRHLVSTVSEAATRHGSSTVTPNPFLPTPNPLSELTNTEQFYQYLTDYMDINAMPHPGGVIVGGMGEHQAAVFNRPELLPSSQYVPAGNQLFEEALQRYNLQRVQRYNADRINQGVGRQWQVAPQASRAPIDLSKMLAVNMAARPGLNNRKTGTPVR